MKPSENSDFSRKSSIQRQRINAGYPAVDVIDSSTDSYVSSDESERATDRRSRKIYERKVSFANETDADSVSPSSINKHAETALAKQAATMPKLEKTMLKDIKTSAPRTMQAFVTFMESQRTDPELWFSTLVANLPQGTVLTSELAQINKQAVSYWVRHKQLKELILSKLPTVRATDDQKEIHIQGKEAVMQPKVAVRKNRLV
eukprot:COSAG01_NODE_20818_length_933_cov_6.375300_1_plen_203_part_00